MEQTEATANKGTYVKVPPYSKAQIDALGEIIDTRDVAGITGRAMQTIRRQVKRGNISAALVGGKYAFSKAAILHTFGLDEEKGVN